MSKLSLAREKSAPDQSGHEELMIDESVSRDRPEAGEQAEAVVAAQRAANDLNLRQLEVFWAVMRCGGITDAARMLEVSQPAVSKMLRQAEERLDLVLFERVRGRLKPTPQAENLYPEVDRIFRGMNGLNRFIQELRAETGGFLRIAASSSFASAFVPEAIARFRAVYPDIRVAFEMMEADQMTELVTASQLDLGLVMAPVHSSAIASEELCGARLVCIMPAGHPLSRLNSVRPADLVDHPMVAFKPDSFFGRVLAEAFRQHGVPRQVAVEVGPSAAACRLVESGVGIAVVNNVVASRLGPEVVSRPFDPTVRLSAKVIYPSLRPLGAPANAFLQNLREVIHERL